MPNYTKEDNIKEVLNYINLDLNNVPDFLKEFRPLNFHCSKTYIDNEYKIYKYIPINKIEILITPKNRLEDMKEKYAVARPVGVYISPKEEEDIPYHAFFLNMLNQVQINKIEEISQTQSNLQKEVPFFIQYNKNYEWQIYYAENTDTYFMLVPSQEAEYKCLFYLLKMQIEYYNKKQVPYIFAPVNYLEYSGEILKKSEITELENFLWIFTKEWAKTYEVTEKNGEKSIHIVGETWVYEGIKSQYKILLNTREDAIRFYKEIKAMFIMQTEIPHYYQFKTKINTNSELEFYYNNEKINYYDLSNFLKREYLKVQQEIKKNVQELANVKKSLDKIKEILASKELEYSTKQRQIATYLEYRKSFFGKVKYYLKLKKGITKAKISKKDNEDKKAEENNKIEEIEKQFYTIEDLVSINSVLEKQKKEINNIQLDEIAAKRKLKSIEKKIENAILYIKEIDSHKKSIFEFWKFASKDEMSALEAGEDNDTQAQVKLRKVFDYETDLEELGIQADRLQRNKLSKEEQDSIFLANTSLIKEINTIKRQQEDKKYEVDDKEILEEGLINQKEEKKSDTTYYSVDNFNLFGSITEELNKEKSLGNKKHREVEKDKFKILELTDATSISEWKNTLRKTNEFIKEAINKIKAIYDMNVYILQENLNDNEYIIGNIIPENALSENKNRRNKETLQILKIKEGMPIVYCTNSIYYDNYNKTLPLGMNVGDKVLIDTNKFNFKEISSQIVYTNMYCENLNAESKPEVIELYIHEYEMQQKEVKKG